MRALSVAFSVVVGVGVGLALAGTRANATSLELWIPPALCSVDPDEFGREAMALGPARIRHGAPSILEKLSIHCPLQLNHGKDNSPVGTVWGTSAPDVYSGVHVYVLDMNPGTTGYGCPGAFCGTVDAQILFQADSDTYEVACAWVSTSSTGYGSWLDLLPVRWGGYCNTTIQHPRASIHIQLPPPATIPQGGYTGYSEFKGIHYSWSE